VTAAATPAARTRQTSAAVTARSKEQPARTTIPAIAAIRLCNRIPATTAATEPAGIAAETAVVGIPAIADEATVTAVTRTRRAGRGVERETVAHQQPCIRIVGGAIPEKGL
jgi:hypothetical protein